ncbi:MAG TPA: hypothetical protein VMF89_31625 [Polyangiales bacterium]|nr:hypothetical protein [Polyangiales bacterium]
MGVLVATQNPLDLDYRALSNAGLWCVGRLQTDADRARVVEGLAGAGGVAGAATASELASVIKQLEPRWFLMRDAHTKEGTRMLMPRYAMSFLKGPRISKLPVCSRSSAWRASWQPTALRPT